MTMHTYAGKAQENKSHAVVNNLPKQKDNNTTASPLLNNRPESVANKELRQSISNSPHVTQLRAYQEIANNSPQAIQLRAYQAAADNYTEQKTQQKKNSAEEKLQGKFEPVQKKENKTGLPDNLKSGIENLSGFYMDDVKVHYNSDKPAQLKAYAYTQGKDIYTAPGQEKHLPHEAWHVVQQKQGRVKPAVQLKEKVNINDDTGLEHEADIMGGKALSAGDKSNGNLIQKRENDFAYTAFENNPQQLKQTGTLPGSTAQLKAIAKAGLELELKGATVYKEGANEADPMVQIAEKTHVHDGVGWWIETDSTHPELVTEAVTTQDDLINKLAEGKLVLEWIQYLAEVAELQDRAKIKEQLAENEIDDKLIPGLVGDASPYIAKPQLSLQVQKGKMNEFAEHVMSGKIQHEKARINKTDEAGHDNQRFDRIHDGVTATIEMLKSTPFFNKVMGPLAANKSDAGGLAWITIITLLHAARHQDPNDAYQYYKAKFSVMPRTALSAMYDALTVDEQTQYKNIMNNWIDFIYMYNEGAANPVETRAQKASKAADDRVKFSAIYRSIINVAERSVKTTMKSGVAAQTDLIASDDVAGTENTGASVGNYDVPAGASGIFELRKMPYVNIKGGEAEKMFKEMIAAYGGM